MNQQIRPKIAIAGAGAVGSLLGGLLARAGNDVTLIGRSGHAAAVGSGGLRIDGVSGSFTVCCNAEHTLTFAPDMVMLAVKMQDLDSVCRMIAPLVNDVPVLTLQNGVGSDAIAGDILGKKKVVGGIVLFNAQYITPGHVTHGSRGTLLIGNVPGGDEHHVRTVHELLQEVIPVRLCGNITGARWTKLFVNLVGNSFDAMTGVPLAECMRSRKISDIAALILKEALTVIQKAHIRMDSLPGIPVTVFRSMIVSPLPVASRLLQRFTRNVDTVSSTLQSLRRGRPTEIDYLNGEIVRLGREMNVPTPCNAKVVELIRNIEKRCRFYSISQVERIFQDGNH